jgi:hypothetical protein
MRRITLIRKLIAIFLMVFGFAGVVNAQIMRPMSFEEFASQRDRWVESQPQAEPQTEVVYVDPPKPEVWTFEKAPFVEIDQIQNEMRFWDGKMLTVYAVKTGAVNMRLRKTEAKVLYAQKGIMHFSGWGNPVVVRDPVAFAAIDGRPLSRVYPKFTPMAHSQPYDCPGVESQIKRGVELKCRVGPEKASGTSHGCIRMDRKDAEDFRARIQELLEHFAPPKVKIVS